MFHIQLWCSYAQAYGIFPLSNNEKLQKIKNQDVKRTVHIFKYQFFNLSLRV